MLRTILLATLLVSPVAAQKQPFAGRLVFEQSAKGGANEKMFNELAPRKITVHIGAHGYRQDEDGGFNEGSFLVRKGAAFALKLDHKEKTSERGGGTRLDDQPDDLKGLMVWHFKTDLKATDETAVIAGHSTRKYQVLKSAFVKAGATAHIWVAEDLDIGKHRYDFHFQTGRTTAPIPLSIPVEKGTILKAEILENGTLVTIATSEITPGEPEAALFSKPDAYEGPDFPNQPPSESKSPDPS